MLEIDVKWGFELSDLPKLNGNGYELYYSGINGIGWGFGYHFGNDEGNNSRNHGICIPTALIKY